MPAKSSVPAKIIQMKVTLEDSKPPIWRRILVGDHLTFEELHYILQLIMDWTNSHLHMFQLGELIIGDPEADETGMLGTQDERKAKLSQYHFSEGDKFIYEYDFGDSWRHKVVIEKILPYSADLQVPVCLKGKRAGPPEDIGGVWGYADFLASLADPDAEDRDEMLEWIGEDFDPEAFDLDEINQALKTIK